MSRFTIKTAEKETTTTWRIEPSNARERIVLPDHLTGQRYKVFFVIVTQKHKATEDPTMATASFWGVRVTETGKYLDTAPVYFEPHAESGQVVKKELEALLKKWAKGDK